LADLGYGGIVIRTKSILLLNILGLAGIPVALFSFFAQPLLGSIIFFLFTFILWLFDIGLLFKQKFSKRLFIVFLLSGIILTLSSLLLQFLYYFYFYAPFLPYRLEYFLINSAFFQGGLLIGNTIRAYRRREPPPPTEVPQTFFMRHIYYFFFLFGSLFGISLLLGYISPAPVSQFICICIAFTAIIPLNYTARRYLQTLQRPPDALLKKYSKYLVSGVLIVFCLVLLLFVLFLLEAPIPLNSLMASLLLLCEVGLLLIALLHHFYPKPLP
jgi:hypothetical protein